MIKIIYLVALGSNPHVSVAKLSLNKAEGQTVVCRLKIVSVNSYFRLQCLIMPVKCKKSDDHKLRLLLNKQNCKKLLPGLHLFHF